MNRLQEKYDKLKEILIRAGSGAIAYSGGVDSTFLVKVAHDLLGDKVMAVTAMSPTFPKREYDEAIEFAETIGVKHVTIESDELKIDGFADNQTNRCYLCKMELFSKIKIEAAAHGLAHVFDGSNLDDVGDFRPGMKAAKELGVLSPLIMAELTKDDIRRISKDLGLPTWDKPSFACLSSRLPYGNKITVEKLRKIERAEQFLLELGFRQVRVRYHGEVARIEVEPKERKKFFNEAILDHIGAEFKKIGFKYTGVDVIGYRTGSMNE